MLHINDIRKNKDTYASLLKSKNIEAVDLFDLVLDLDEERKKTQHLADQLGWYMGGSI